MDASECGHSPTKARWPLGCRLDLGGDPKSVTRKQHCKTTDVETAKTLSKFILVVKSALYLVRCTFQTKKEPSFLGEGFAVIHVGYMARLRGQSIRLLTSGSPDLRNYFATCSCFHGCVRNGMTILYRFSLALVPRLNQCRIFCLV